MGQPKKRRNYESEEEDLSDVEAKYRAQYDDESEFLALSSKYLGSKYTTTTATEADVEVPDENDATGDVGDAIDRMGDDSDEEARDAWGNRATGFYVDVDEEDDDASDDEDAELLEMQLTEAREIQREHLESLGLADYETARADYLVDMGEGTSDQEGAQKAGRDYKENAVGLDLLLASLGGASGGGVTRATRKLPSSVMELCDYFGPLVEECEAEGLSFLKLNALRRATGADPLGGLSDTCVTFLQSQVQLVLWYCLILNGISACKVTELPLDLMNNCRSLAKATRKIKKLRDVIGDFQFTRLRQSLKTALEVLTPLVQKEDLPPVVEKEKATHADSLSPIDRQPRKGRPQVPPTKTMLKLEKNLNLRGMNRLEAARAIAREHTAQFKRQAEAKYERLTGTADLEASKRESRPSPQKGEREVACEPVAAEPSRETLDAIEQDVMRIKKQSKLAKEKRAAKRKEEALQRLPPLLATVEAGVTRQLTRAITTNRGLTRTRKPYAGHARVHNRIKYAKKLKKLSGITPKAKGGVTASGDYSGELTGINEYVRRSRKL